jgi:hypothetical protein
MSLAAWHVNAILCKLHDQDTTQSKLHAGIGIGVGLPMMSVGFGAGKGNAAS